MPWELSSIDSIFKPFIEFDYKQKPTDKCEWKEKNKKGQEEYLHH
jgi:hypothetical protein